MKTENKIEDGVLGNGMDKRLEQRLEGTGWQDAVKAITLPGKMKEDLTEACSKKKKNIFCRFNYAKLIPAVCMAVILAASGITAHAVYINTHLNVFVTHDITSEQLSDLETSLRELEGISSCRYISGDEAWKEFSEAYLTPEITETFSSNPLADSANLRVGIALNADIEEIRETIEKLDGVRHVSGLWEN